MPDDGPRSRHRRLAPLVLIAAALGAAAMIDRALPRRREVVLELGEAAPYVRDVEVSWVRARAGTEEAEVTTRWHFAVGTAPERLGGGVRLPDGAWDVEVGVERFGASGTTRWSGRVNLERIPWWKRDNLKRGPVILPVREALR